MTTPPAELPFRPNRFGNESNRPIITVNMKYGRLYFSVNAIKSLALDQDNFRIFKKGKRWLLSKSTVRADHAMKFYERAYYIVAKQLVYDLANHFAYARPSFLIEGADRKRKYYNLKFFIQCPVKKPPRASSKTYDLTRKDPQVVSAEKIIARFESTNFDGRVKTREILNAERKLNRSTEM